MQAYMAIDARAYAKALRAPTYVKLRYGGPGQVDIVYAFFYAFNGFKTFQAGIHSLFQPTPYDFEWSAWRSVTLTRTVAAPNQPRQNSAAW